MTPAPEREWPWTLFAIALTGVLLGGGFGMAVNYLAGQQPGDLAWAAPPRYTPTRPGIAILGWPDGAAGCSAASGGAPS